MTPATRSPLLSPDDARLFRRLGYKLLPEFEEGGMSIVHKALDLSHSRIVALKMPWTRRYARREERERFAIEVEGLTVLKHPHIIRLYEAGEDQGLCWFAMEWMAGGSVKTLLQKQPVLPDEAVRLVETLARTMHYVHLRGWLHRDLKPANLLLTAGNVVKITDFGLAKDQVEDSGLTAPGTVMGTPCYMSPEQAAGRTREVGPQTDIYSLGVILYEMLTGRPPFRGPTPQETRNLIINGELIPPSAVKPNLPRELDSLCLKCLAKQPGERYPSAAALADHLHSFLSDRGQG
jgi:serine/threonine protein kinase